MTTLFANGQHEELGGGSFRTTLGLRPVNYLANGVYQPINNDWIDGDQDSPHVVSAAPMRVRADGVGRRNIYPIPGNDAVYISIGRPWYQPSTWQVAPMNPLERANNRLQSINSNYNLYLDHAGHFAKLGILLKGGFVPPNSRFAFPVSLVGLTRQGNAILHNGQPVMNLRRPVVYDFANPEDERAITFNFGAFGSQTGVIFNLPDLTGMGMPVVDPTLALQPDATAGVDAYINSQTPTTNAGTGTSFSAGDPSGSTSMAGRGVLRFDVSPITAGTVTAVTFSLFEAAAAGAGGNVGIRRLLVSWTEGGVTWNSRNGTDNWTTAGASSNGNDRAASDSATLSRTGAAAAAFVNWTGSGLVSDVQGWINTPASNFGWLVQAPTLENAGVAPENYRNFPLSDHATAANRPKLTIEYTLPGGAGIMMGVL